MPAIGPTAPARSAGPTTSASTAASMGVQATVVAAMADEIEREYLAWVKSGQVHADQVPREVLKARVFLREAFGGEIWLEADAAGGLMGHWMQQSACLMSAAVGCRPIGSGGLTLIRANDIFTRPTLEVSL